MRCHSTPAAIKKFGVVNAAAYEVKGMTIFFLLHPKSCSPSKINLFQRFFGKLSESRINNIYKFYNLLQEHFPNYGSNKAVYSFMQWRTEKYVIVSVELRIGIMKINVLKTPVYDKEYRKITIFYFLWFHYIFWNYVSISLAIKF